jgi:hypothetical protein
VALWQVFSEYFGFPCQFSFHRLLNIHHHLSSGAGTVRQKYLTSGNSESSCKIYDNRPDAITVGTKRDGRQESSVNGRQRNRILISARNREFCLPHNVHTGSEDPFPVVKRPEREADLSLLPNVKIKNVWSCTSTPHMPLWCDV